MATAASTEINLVLKGITFSMAVLVLSAFFGLRLLLDHLTLPIQAPWIDAALGQALSEKYGEAVSVKDVKIVRWDDVRFKELTVLSNSDGELLIHADSGRISLKKMGLRKGSYFETEVQLEHVEFSKNYYKNSEKLRPWVYLMWRPFCVENLGLLISQGGGETTVRVTKCESEDILISGTLALRNWQIVRDNISTSLSPLTLLKMMV